jgi:uncharacterized protein (DUF362 family)
MTPASSSRLSRSGLSRRRLIAAAGSLVALESCQRPATPWPAVSIRRMNSYSGDLTETLRGILAEHRLDVRGKRVVLKPNLVEFDERTTINTHPALVGAVRDAFLAAGAAEVRIAEGPGHRRVTLDLADAAGYFSTIRGFENLFTDLNLDELTAVPLANPKSKLSSLYLPNTVLGCDLLVSMPKLKTHHWAGITASMKNLFGVVPGAVYGWPKNILHMKGIDNSILDLNATVRPQFTIVDAVTAMEGDGPIMGKPRHMGLLAMSTDLAAADATCARLIGIDPREIPYLAAAGEFLGNIRESRIEHRGERPDRYRAVYERIAPSTVGHA